MALSQNIKLLITPLRILNEQIIDIFFLSKNEPDIFISFRFTPKKKDRRNQQKIYYKKKYDYFVQRLLNSLLDRFWRFWASNNR